MKKFVLIIASAAVLGALFGALPAALAAGDPATRFEAIIKGSGLTDFSRRIHQLSSVDQGADVITSIIFIAIDFLKYLIGGVAIIFLTVSGIKLIVAGKKIDEISEKEKENFKFIIYGFILIMVADQLVSKVFFGDYGECIASATNAADCAKFGGNIIQGIYSLILSLIGTLSVFVIAVSGFRMATSFGNEEDLGKQKKRIGMAIAGLILAGVGEFVIKGIIFPAAGAQGIDVAAAQMLVYRLTNFISAFIGIGSFVMFIYGGYLYIASFGNEEAMGKGKKIILGGIIGIIIALAAFGVVRTVTNIVSQKVVVENPR